MLQRIQSLYFLLVAILTGAMFFTPISVYKLKISGTDSLLVNNLVELFDYNAKRNLMTLYPLACAAVAILLIALFSIFLFKNRKMQILLSKINFALMVVLISLLFFYVDFQVKCFTRETPFSTIYLLGAYLPFGSLFLTFLAIKAIQKDEELVRSADRLR